MNHHDKRWQLESPSGAAYAFLLLVTLALPVGITIAALTHAFQAEDAALRLIGNSRELTTWVTLGGIALFSASLWWFLHRVFSRHRLTLADDALEIATTFYRRRLPMSELRLDEARVVDLDERTELRPMLKTNGAGLPGFKSGWFRLRNRNKALVAMAGGKRVAWIPTRAGYDLLLQTHSPQALLDELRKMADRAPRR